MFASSPPHVLNSEMLRVLYASQTGVAKDAAEGLARDAALRGYPVGLDSLAGWDCSRLERACADGARAGGAAPPLLWLFVASTTGDGAMPTNGQRFWRSLLRRDVPRGALAAVRFSVLGLGDSTYAKFNAAARKLHTRLLQLGAVPFLERGLADEQSPLGLVGDQDIWARGLWAALAAAVPQRPAGAEAPTDLRPRLVRSPYAVRPAEAGDGAAARQPAAASDCDAPAHAASGRGGDQLGPDEDAGPAPLVPSHAAVVTANIRLTAAGWRQDVRHIELDVSSSSNSSGGGGGGGGGPAAAPCAYQPGDVAWVFPRNTHGGLLRAAGAIQPSPAAKGGDGAAAMTALCAALGVQLSDRITISLRGDDDDDDDERTGKGDDLASAAACATTTTTTTGDCKADAPPSLQPPVLASSAPLVPWPFDSQQYDSTASLRPFSPPAHFATSAALVREMCAGAAATPQPPFAVTTTIRKLLEGALDLHGVPRRGFFQQLAFFASDDEQAAKLRELGAPEGADIYHAYCDRERRSYAEVLCEFPSVRLPLAYLLQLLPPLQPRAYSIASSALHTPGRVALCVAVAGYTTPWGRRKAGVSSSWLASLQPGDVVPLAITRGTFRLPGDPAVPLLLVGPGTGVAPMRSIILERAAVELALPPRQQLQQRDTRDALQRGGGGGITLYFGCRHRACDWLYGPELARLAGAAASPAQQPQPVLLPLAPPAPHGVDGDDGGGAASSSAALGAPLELDRAAAQSSSASAAAAMEGVGECAAGGQSPATPVVSQGAHDATPAANSASFSTGAAAGGCGLAAFHTAFSRDAPGRVLYVQGLLERQRARVFALLTGSPPAVVFIAGSAKRMPADVLGALRDVLCDVGGASVPEADSFLARMEREGRLVVEAWS